MKSVPYSACREEPKEQQNADSQSRLIMKVRNGDIEAAAQLLMRYHKKVISVAYDVLQDETLARESARETLKSTIKQLRRGIRTGEFEPWLMWMTRCDALRYTQLESNTEKRTKQPELKITVPEEPVDVNLAHLMRKYASELSEMPYIDPRNTENKESIVQTAVSQDGTAILSSMHRSKESKSDDEPKAEKQKKNRTRSPKNTCLAVIMAMLCMIFLWLIFGLIARNADGSFLDLGYSWFNNNLFPLF